MDLRYRLVLALVLLTGCAGYDLDPKWYPLEVVKERPGFLGFLYTDSAMMTTIGNTLYVDDLEYFKKKYPPDSQSFIRIMAHERVHSIRQTAGVPFFGLAWWLLKYVFSTEFMWDEERMAAYFEYKYNVRRSSAEEAKAFSEHYFNIFGMPMISYEEALKWVEQAKKDEWAPDLTTEEIEDYSKH